MELTTILLRTRDVPSRVRVRVLGRVLNHYHFDLFLLFIRI